jgi:hypothetical protein
MTSGADVPRLLTQMHPRSPLNDGRAPHSARIRAVSPHLEEDSWVAEYRKPLPEGWEERLADGPAIARTWAAAVFALAETVAGKPASWRFDTEPASTTMDDYLTMLDDRLVLAREVEGDEQLTAWLDAEVDRVFREITDEATTLMITVSGGSIALSDEWWFHRAPRAGFVREALRCEARELSTHGEQ